MIELTRLNGTSDGAEQRSDQDRRGLAGHHADPDQRREADCARGNCARWWSGCSPIARACWPPWPGACRHYGELQRVGVAGQPGRLRPADIAPAVADPSQTGDSR